MLTAPELRRNYNNITKLLEKIDDSVKQKGSNSKSEKFDLVTVGHEMMKANAEFYQSGIKLGEKSFSTLATEPENKRDLAMSFLASIYSAWIIQKEREFNVLEIGAGSGDLMSEIFTIRDEVLKSDSSSEIQKDFFNSLKFSIVDFPQMIEIQKSKFGINADEVNYIENDISKNLIPETYDFIIGNEIPDTQRVDFLEVKVDGKTGEKKHYLRAIKTKQSGESSEVLACISTSPEIMYGIGKNLFPIEDLEPGVYKLQFGFHALMHNIKQSLKPQHGRFILSDYFTFEEKYSSHDLSFAGQDGISLNELKKFEKIAQPGEQLIEAKKMYGVIDVTYSPNVGNDTLDIWSLNVSSFNDDDDRSRVVTNLKFSSESIQLLKTDSLFGKKFNDFLKNFPKSHGELMNSELSQCRTLSKIRKEEDGAPSFQISLRSSSGEAVASASPRVTRK